MKVTPTRLPEVLLIEPQAFADRRGWFMEAWHSERYAGYGLPEKMLQSNLSYSGRGTVRGLHYQQPRPQGKLVQVLQGEVFDVAVDIRTGSPSFGDWVADTLSAGNRRQLWIPPGFAHGFQVLSDGALFTYLCSEHYAAECDRAIQCLDSAIGIAWPLPVTGLSGKDEAAPRLANIEPERLPVYGHAAGS